MDKSSLGDRMKNYESISSGRLTPHVPVIIRLDGKAFHTWTKGLDKPWDLNFISIMKETSKYLAKELGASLVYSQSDEISILLTQNNAYSEPWFGYKIQKMVSVSASMATAAFNKHAQEIFPGKNLAFFDSRVFNLPVHDVENYFIWRQKDAIRNSVQMLARFAYPQKECHGKNSSDLIMMLEEKSISWEKQQTFLKRGYCVVRKDVELLRDDGTSIIRKKYTLDTDIPIFSSEREYINREISVVV